MGVGGALYMALYIPSKVCGFNPSTQKGKAGRSLSFEASLLYRGSSRAATYKNPLRKSLRGGEGFLLEMRPRPLHTLSTFHHLVTVITPS